MGEADGRWVPPPQSPDWGDVGQTEERRFLYLLTSMVNYGEALMHRAGFYQCRLCYVEFTLGHLPGCPVGELRKALLPDWEAEERHK